MNKATVYSNVTLCHRKHPLQFNVGIGFQGKLINGRVKGMESLAQFYFKNLKNKKIDFIIIKENNTEEVLIERK